MKTLRNLVFTCLLATTIVSLVVLPVMFMLDIQVSSFNTVKCFTVYFMMEWMIAIVRKHYDPIGYMVSIQTSKSFFKKL